MKTKHFCIQMIKEREILCSEYGEVIESDYIYIVRLDKYVTGNIIVTKGSYRNLREDGKYHSAGEYRGEEEFQALVKFFKKEGYKLL